MNKYEIVTSIACFVCYLIGYVVGIKHGKRTITHECVKDTHDKTSPNSSENPNNCETCKYWEHGAGNHYYCARLEMRQECHYEPKTEPQIIACPIQDDYAWIYEDEPQTEVVNDNQELVKDLVKAFGEDGTWLERQGVYTLTLAEAKQRAVDIIESVIAKTEPQTDVFPCNNCKNHDECCTKEFECKYEPQTEDAYSYDEDDWYDKAERSE